MMDLGKLRRQRSVAFWRELLPFARYVATSGLAVFMFLLFIVSVHYYAELVVNLPEHIPVNWIAAICLLPIIGFNPIRTFLRSADIVFLLPSESQMNDYLQRGFLRSAIVQTSITIVVWLIVWPLYRAYYNADIVVFVVIAIVLMMMKWTSLYARWQELQFQEQRHRTKGMMIRWIMSAVLLYFLFSNTVYIAMLVVAITLLVYIVILRLVTKLRLNWDHLIEVEKSQHAHYYTFLSWFVDVPAFANKVRSRRYIGWLTNMVKFKQNKTFHYLYTLTFFRSDVYGMVARLTMIGFAITWLVTLPVLKGAVFLFFCYCIAVQLSALAQRHNYAFWLQIYPLHATDRIRAVTAVIMRIHAVCIVVIYVAILLSGSSWQEIGYNFMFAVVLFATYHMTLRRRLFTKKQI